MAELVIIGDDFNDANAVEGGPRGLVPRDYKAHPVGRYPAIPSMRALQMPTIPMAEWPARIAALKASGATMTAVRMAGASGQPIPSLDQNDPRWPDGKHWGYCWAHSVVHGVMLRRALDNQPYEALSAFSPAAMIKQGRNEGAWGALAADYVTEHGVVPQRLWPQKEADYRKYGTPEAWAEGAKYKIAEGWADLEAAVYDRGMSILQQGTCLLTLTPLVMDFNWWGHSVLGIELVDVYPNRPAADPNRYGVQIWNSWADTWSDYGMGLLKDGKQWADGGVAIRAVRAAA